MNVHCILYVCLVYIACTACCAYTRRYAIFGCHFHKYRSLSIWTSTFDWIWLNDSISEWNQFDAFTHNSILILESIAAPLRVKAKVRIFTGNLIDLPLNLFPHDIQFCCSSWTNAIPFKFNTRRCDLPLSSTLHLAMCACAVKMNSSPNCFWVIHTIEISRIKCIA